MEARTVAHVLVPEPYRGPTRGVGEISASGETIFDCLESVESEYPGFIAQVVDGSGQVHRFVKLFLNGVQLDSATALATTVSASDEIKVLAAIAGG